MPVPVGGIAADLGKDVAGSIGGSNPASLYQAHLESVWTRVRTLPPDTTLLPGHGPATTVREEVTHNPFADHE